MNYSEAIQFLYDLRRFGLKFGLETTRRLASFAGNPQDRLRFIHVAGTNGKGSTCAMLESIYRAAGLRVGLYTSPHLVAFAERIQVNRQLIPEREVVRLVEELKGAPIFSGDDGPSPTFFEAVTVMALKYFAEQQCDLVIWETGMGGRLDATNIVTPLATIITNVQLDHQQWLGKTVAEIAREKAGIIKERVPAITGAADADVLRVITETARQHHAPLTVVTSSDAQAMHAHEIPLTGEHQRLNAAVAVKTTEILAGQVPVAPSDIRHGLQETQWAGRCQIIRRDNGQTVLLDGAHNPAGALTLADTVKHEFPEKKAALILGIMRYKDADAICRILAPLARHIFLAPIASEGTADPQLLASYCRAANPGAIIAVCRNLADAFDRAASENFVILTGSLYFVGEALEFLGHADTASERRLNDYGSPSQRKTPIRAVTFDVGGTLIEPWPSVGDVYSQVAARHGLQISPQSLNKKFAAAWEAKKNFRHSRSDWSDLVKQTFRGLAPTPLKAGFFDALYDAFADAAAWRIYDDVRPCLERLRRNGFKLGIISNWDERLRPLLKALDLERYFEVIIVSIETGQPKPAREIFHLAASQLETPPESILHIGDSRAEDCEGARGAGFQALHLRRGAGPALAEGLASLDDLKFPGFNDKVSSRVTVGSLISY